MRESYHAGILIGSAIFRAVPAAEGLNPDPAAAVVIPCVVCVWRMHKVCALTVRNVPGPHGAAAQGQNQHNAS
jgi:hypothetical protein